MLRPDPEEWVLEAACHGIGDLFFPPDDVAESRPERREREARAKAVCEMCAVRLDCLEEAVVGGERFGIWGGLTERERRSSYVRKQFEPQDDERLRSIRGGRDFRSPPEDIAGPGRLVRLPAVVVQDRQMSPLPGD